MIEISKADVVEFLEKKSKEVNKSIMHAHLKPNVSDDELNNLIKKRLIIEYLVKKETDDEGSDLQ